MTRGGQDEQRNGRAHQQWNYSGPQWSGCKHPSPGGLQDGGHSDRRGGIDVLRNGSQQEVGISDDQLHLAPLPQLLVDDDDAAACLGISRAHFLAMVRAGRVDVTVVRLGRRRLYSVPSLRAWVEGGCKPCPRGSAKFNTGDPS